MQPETRVLEATRPPRSRLAGAAGLLALGAALLLALGACGTTASTSDVGTRLAQSASSTTRPALGVVAGTYQLQGGPISLSGHTRIRPLGGFITATGAHGHAKVTVKDGRFRLDLPPGTYNLVGWTPSIKEVQGSKVVKNGATCGTATVVVTQHHTAKAAVYCDVP
jgi:hypothetical protein